MKNGGTSHRFPRWTKYLLPTHMAALRTKAWRIGHRGELAAAEYLQNAGYDVLCMNWLAPRNLGELDIVCRDDGGTLCAVEVKTRRWNKKRQPMPMPLLAVTPEKKRRLRRAFSAYLQTLGSPKLPFRYDVIEIWANPSGKPETLRHWTDRFAGRPRATMEG